MNSLLFSYIGNSRDLKRVIVSLLKSWCASKVEKVNYVQSFSLEESIIKKNEIKYIFVYTEDEWKLLNFLSKNFPQIEKVIVK